jgi:hypothetical protein
MPTTGVLVNKMLRKNWFSCIEIERKWRDIVECFVGHYVREAFFLSDIVRCPALISRLDMVHFFLPGHPHHHHHDHHHHHNNNVLSLPHTSISKTVTPYPSPKHCIDNTSGCFFRLLKIHFPPGNATENT